jgi:hypothetical protein
MPVSRPRSDELTVNTTHTDEGEEDTYEAAGDEFKKVFWTWHGWALKQEGKATWYGAIE